MKKKQNVKSLSYILIIFAGASGTCKGVDFIFETFHDMVMVLFWLAKPGHMEFGAFEKTGSTLSLVRKFGIGVYSA